MHRLVILQRLFWSVRLWLTCISRVWGGLYGNLLRLLFRFHRYRYHRFHRFRHRLLFHGFIFRLGCLGCLGLSYTRPRLLRLRLCRRLLLLGDAKGVLVVLHVVHVVLKEFRGDIAAALLWLHTATFAEPHQLAP